MKKHLMEETVLFISILKWAVLATVVGLVVGLSTTVFLKLLGISSGIVQVHRYYYLFLPLVMFLSSFIVKYLAPDAEGHGTEKVIEAIHKHSGRIKLAVVPVKLVATIITLAGGGSAGKEGPCAQIGAGMASGIADLLRLTDEDRRKLVICGISAGFASVFGTPIAGALFAVEVLILGRILHEVLFPALVAAILSVQVTKAFGITYFHQSIQIAGFSQKLVVEMLLSGLFFGLVALVLVEVLKLFEHLASKLTFWKPWKGVIGGTILTVLAFVVSPRYLGLGVNTIESAIHGAKIPGLAFLWKIVFTGVTLSMGGSGGILTPIFFIGTTSGVTFAHLFHMNSELCAAIGMVALLSGAANTPIAASVMAIEMFGPQIGTYAALACVVSYIAAGHRSVYGSQIIGVAKSSSLHVPIDTDIHDLVNVEVQEKPGKIIYRVKRAIHWRHSE